MLLSTISLVIASLSIFTSIILFFWKYVYENPKLKNVVWIYNSIKENFYDALVDFREKCDSFLKDMVPHIDNKKTWNRLHKIRISKGNSFYYSPYRLKTNNSKELSIIVQKTKICFVFYVIEDIENTQNRINKKIHILYKNNKWSRNWKK